MRKKNKPIIEKGKVARPEAPSIPEQLEDQKTKSIPVDENTVDMEEKPIKKEEPKKDEDKSKAELEKKMMKSKLAYRPLCQLPCLHYAAGFWRSKSLRL